MQEAGAPIKKRSLVESLAAAAIAAAALFGISAQEYVFRYRDAVSHMDVPTHLIGAVEVMTRAAGNRAYVWYSLKTLAKMWNITERAAVDRVNALQEHGLIQKVVREGKDDHEQGKEARSNIYIFPCVEGFKALSRVTSSAGAAPAPPSRTSPAPTPAPAPARKKRAFTKEELDSFLSAILAEPELALLSGRNDAAKLLGLRKEGQSCLDATKAMAELADKTPPGTFATYREAVSFLRGQRVSTGPEYLDDKPEPVIEAAPPAPALRNILSALSGRGPPTRPS